MATTTVQGEVTRVFFDGRGAEVTEQYEIRGEARKTRWAAFFESPHGLEVGQQVEVSGLHGDKLDEWPDRDDPAVTRRSVKRTLNRARIVGEVTPAGGAWEHDPWTTGTESTPF